MKIDRIVKSLSIICVLITTMIVSKVQAETNYISGYLYGNHKWVASNTYILKGFTYVMNNAVLDIEAGTIIKGASGSGTSGNAANDFGCLFVCRGGKVNAVGSVSRYKEETFGTICCASEVGQTSYSDDCTYSRYSR